jgi:hypothetical protein
VLQPQVPFPYPEAARRDVPRVLRGPADRLAHRYQEAVRRVYAAVAQSPDSRPRVERMSAAPFAESPRVLASRQEAAEAEVSSVASAQREPSSLPGAAAVGEAVCVRAVQPSAEPAGRDAREQAAVAALDARAQPREAAVAEPDAAPEAAAAVPDAGLAAAEPDAARQQGAAEAAVLDAALQPAAVRDAVLRRAAGPSAAGLSAGRWDQPLPWLAP